MECADALQRVERRARNAKRRDVIAALVRRINEAAEGFDVHRYWRSAGWVRAGDKWIARESAVGILELIAGKAIVIAIGHYQESGERIECNRRSVSHARDRGRESEESTTELFEGPKVFWRK